MNRGRTAAVVVCLIITFVGLIGYAIFTVISRTGKEPIEVYSVPSDATITANGQTIHTGTQYLPAGTYEIVAKKEGFADYKEAVVIGTPNKEIIDAGLEAVSDQAKAWAKQNNTLYLEREGRGGKRAREKGEEFKRLNPITKELPIDNVLYTLSYTVDLSDPTHNSIILQITAPSGYRESVLNKIRELGYDPTNFKINFNLYESPFKQ